MFNCWLKAGTWALHTLSHRILKKKKKAKCFCSIVQKGKVPEHGI